MRKVKTIFKKDPADLGRVINEVNIDMEWVFNGEGRAYRKLDGTCVLIRNGMILKRYTLRKGKTPPASYEQVDFDENTGKGFGWIQVDLSDNANRYHKEAWYASEFLHDGTYELIGPKVQGNPENQNSHIFVPHVGTGNYSDIPLEFDEMREWLAGKDIEGVVFHHLDGRMGKVRKSDFGLTR